jgi:hypothetical protein
MRRIRLLWLAPVAGVALAAGIAASGSAQSSGPRTITIIAKTAKGGFFPKQRPHSGERFGFTDTIKSSDGGKGHDYGVCTLVTRVQSVCQVQFILNTGQISAQVPVNLNARNNTGAVTGGTGAYVGATGQGTAHNVNSKTTKVTISLLG